MKCRNIASKKETITLVNRPTPATIYRSKIASFKFSGILYLPSISFKSEIRGIATYPPRGSKETANSLPLYLIPKNFGPNPIENFRTNNLRFFAAMKCQSLWNIMEPLKNITTNAIEVAEEIKKLNVSSNFAGHYLASNGNQENTPII